MAPPCTAKRKMAKPDVKPKKTQKSTKILEDHLQLKNPLDCEMLVLVEMGLDPSVVIPTSTETEPELGMLVPVEPGLVPSVVMPSSRGLNLKAQSQPFFLNPN